jgi:hypothetical protein
MLSDIFSLLLLFSFLFTIIIIFDAHFHHSKRHDIYIIAEPYCLSLHVIFCFTLIYGCRRTELIPLATSAAYYPRSQYHLEIRRFSSPVISCIFYTLLRLTLLTLMLLPTLLDISLRRWSLLSLHSIEHIDIYFTSTLYDIICITSTWLCGLLLPHTYCAFRFSLRARSMKFSIGYYYIFIQRCSFFDIAVNSCSHIVSLCCLLRQLYYILHRCHIYAVTYIWWELAL